MPHYVCENCGFWQRYFAPGPPDCPVCCDYRHPLPPAGWQFSTPAEVGARLTTQWAEVLPGIWQFWNEPTVGIGPRGYLILDAEHGNVAFEGAGYYDAAALEFIGTLGGIRYLSASHCHVFGALWQLVEAFGPEVVMQQDELPFCQAFRVSWPYEDRAELHPGAVLYHTGRHTPGHAVLHLPARQLLCCGDALKFKLDGLGHPTHISTHRAYDAHIPLSHGDARHYQRVLLPLDFDGVLTPWEPVASGGKAAAAQLFAAQLAGRPFADFLPLSSPTMSPQSLPDPVPVALYKSALPTEPVYEIPLTSLDYLSVPVWSLAQWLPGGMSTGTGYGATDGLARVGAYGEITEETFVNLYLTQMPRRRASYRQLQAEGVACLDPLRDRLPAGTAYTPDTELVWTQAHTYPANEIIWVPIETAATWPGDWHGQDQHEWLYTPITNGMGAGESLERALSHGLLELLQRDGNAINYRALDQGVRIELDDVQDPATRELLRQYDEAGLEIQVKLASTDFGITSLYVVGYERDINRVPHPLMLTGCGEAAHPDREVALAKALREYASSRVRKRFEHGDMAWLETVAPGYLAKVRHDPPVLANQEPRAAEAMRQWLELSPKELFGRLQNSVFSVQRTVKFSELPTVPFNSIATPADLLRVVHERLAAAGLSIYYVEFTNPASPVRTLKAIVPELEVETMTYDRIGRRNLTKLLARQSPLVGLGTPPPGAQRVPLPTADEVTLGGPAWFNTQLAREQVGELYALYREPERHVYYFSDSEAAPTHV
jgi:thiazole/oxazole-forming peptide maturase SagD family component